LKNHPNVEKNIHIRVKGNKKSMTQQREGWKKEPIVVVSTGVEVG
jgi:hypothetical protein